MGLLSEESLEFAKEHVERYYDSDFFPKPEEYKAIWHSWNDVKKELSSTNVGKMFVENPNTSTSAKPKGGFRVVQQLDPLRTLIYTALAYTVAEAIEKKRVPRNLNIACSYRIELKNGSFFADGNGFEKYIDKSKDLASNFKYVLYTDITDFYNQIYLHRLNNAISHADESLSDTANDIESFLSKLNGKNSQGVPVGPAASIVMSEAVLMDIDEYLISQGVQHTRYVDDFRIFSDDREKLIAVLEDLTLYLYKTHRLTIATDKTKIMECEHYLNEILFNHYEIEKKEIINRIEVYNPYSDQYEELNNPFLDEEDIFTEQIGLVADKILESDHLDIGIARYFLRKSKKYKISKSAKVVFDNFNLFQPVISDVFLYLDRVTDSNFIQEWQSEIINLMNSNLIKRNLVKIWFEWYVARNAELLKIPEINNFVFNNASISCQSKAAIKLNKLSWIRNMKENLYQVNNKDRLAILKAAQILPKDERDHWLRLTEQTAPLPIDRWVAKWVRETN